MSHWIGVKLTVFSLSKKLFIILASKSKIMKKILFTLFLIGCIANSNAQVPSYVPTDGLVGYWPFNGNANDETGNGNNGTVNGATLTSDRDGNENSAYYLNVNSSGGWGQAQNRITVSNPTISNDNSFTMSAWINLETKPSPFNNRQHTIMGRWDGNGVAVFRHQINYSGEIRTNLKQGTNSNIVVGGSVSYGEWYHIVITYDGSILKQYINNQLTNQEQLNIDINTSSTDLTFGELHMANGHWYLFSGKMDDLGYWNRALTEQEVANLYTSNSSNECSTLVINTGVLSTSPVTYTSTVNIYPNPANDQLTIDCGNLDNVDGWNIKITNMLGQEVFNEPMNTQQYVIPLNTWTGQGMYFVKIINAENKVVNIKKIILQ